MITKIKHFAEGDHVLTTVAVIQGKGLSYSERARLRGALEASGYTDVRAWEQSGKERAGFGFRADTKDMDTSTMLDNLDADARKAYEQVTV